MKIYHPKYKSLISYLKKLGNAAIAYSGGVDSTFLLCAAKEALGNKIIAMTVLSPYIAKWEIAEAKEITQSKGIQQLILEVGIPEEIRNNPSDRCYLCKTKIFTRLLSEAKANGFKYVLDGTNADDINDYRPGMKALTELAIKSPLTECGITKQEIRDFSKQLNLPTWDKPAYACLLTRIPYDTELKIDELQRIERSEKFMMDLGFKAVRVRSHNYIARIELEKNRIAQIFENNLADKIATTLKSYGYKYVSIDLQGYRTGSLNEMLGNMNTDS